MFGMAMLGFRNKFKDKMRLLLIILILTSCQNKPKNGSEKTILNPCSDSVKYTKLISKSINLPVLQQYYKVQDNINQKELVILNNSQYLNIINQLDKFNNPVRLLNSNEIKQKEIKAYLDYKEINIKNDTAKIYYRYDIQGIEIKSSYILKECEWHLIESDLWEN